MEKKTLLGVGRKYTYLLFVTIILAFFVIFKYMPWWGFAPAVVIFGKWYWDANVEQKKGGEKWT